FFHDEAVALAAGHRPCALCRRESYNAYRKAWATGDRCALPSATEIDRQLHGERIYRGAHRRRPHTHSRSPLPSGGFVLLDDGPALIAAPNLIVPWTTEGYGRARERPRVGKVKVITPPSTLVALRHGYRPQIGTAVTWSYAEYKPPDRW